MYDNDHRRRDRRYLLDTPGQENVVTHLDAHREYNEVVRQYRGALLRHRRAGSGEIQNEPNEKALRG